MEVVVGGILVTIFYLLPAWLIWQDRDANEDQKIVWILAASVFSWFGYIAFMLTGRHSEETKNEK